MGVFLHLGIAFGTVLALVTVIAGTIIYFIGKIIYLAFFHPLARYPGPFLAKFSNVHSAYHVWKGDLHIDMWKCHQQYGEYVRYGPNKLLINSTTCLRDVYGINKNTSKSSVYNIMVHQVQNSLTMTDKKEHSRRRRILSYGFSDAALRRYELSIVKRIDRLTEQLCNSKLYTAAGMATEKLSKTWSTSQDMATWFKYLTFDIMTDVVFGEDFDLISKPEHRYVISSIEKSNHRTGVLVQMPSFKFLRLDKKLFPVAIAARNQFLKFANRLMKTRIPAGRKTPSDVITCLLDAKDPTTGEGLSVPEILAESVTMIVAGSDTSSSALSACLFYLCRFPEAYKRLADEVRTAFPTRESICLGPEMNSCVFMRACINEAMRMTPPVGGAPYREIDAGGCLVGDRLIPAGVDVGTSIYAIHHNEEYFPNAFSYNPDRWLQADGKTLVNHPAFNPFSVGPRGCTGKGLAMAELVLTLAHLFSRFEFRTADGELGRVGEGDASGEFGRHRSKEFQVEDFITSQTKGPFVKWMPREENLLSL